MGPIALFDKSFLQSLSLDEAVWFDRFFTSIICPIFYVETLADLAKHTRDSVADKQVRIISEKTPEMSSSPCYFHQELAVSNLLGQEIPMNARVPRPAGRFVSGGGRIGVVFDSCPELEAFERWQNEEFSELERLFASSWRRLLREVDLSLVAKILKTFGVDGKSCKSLEQAQELAEKIVNGSSKPYAPLALAVNFFSVPPHQHHLIEKRWRELGQPVLSSFAPYAAYVLTIEIFFHISIAANLISANRPSNRTDIEYLFYLPFCMVFVSNDKLHSRVTRLFLRKDQEYVQGTKLKSDLRRLNDFYLKLPEEERAQGVIKMVDHPPTEGDFLTTSLWRRCLSKRAFFKQKNADEIDEEMSRKLVRSLSEFTEGETLQASQVPKSEEEIEAMGIRRRVSRRRGSWLVVPSDLPGSMLEE